MPLEQVSRQAVVYTEVWTGVWTGPQLHWHINCLELLAVIPGLEPSQEALTRRACTGPHGQHCNRCVHQPTRWSTLPSHVATRPPPLESEASEVTSRHSHSGLAQPGRRRAVTSCAPVGPVDLKTFRTRTGRPVRVPRDLSLSVVLLPDRGNTRHGRSSTQLAAGPLQVCISPSEPSRTDTVQDQRGRGADPRDSPSLADSSEEGSTDSETGHFVAPASRPLGTSCLVPGRDAEVLGDLPQEVVYSITSARALSTRHAYALKWNLFVNWCFSHREEPGSARSELYCPSCSKGWSKGCFSPPSKSV